MLAKVSKTESSLSKNTLKWSSELQVLGAGRYICQLQNVTPAAEESGCTLCNELT